MTNARLLHAAFIFAVLTLAPTMAHEQRREPMWGDTRVDERVDSRSEPSLALRSDVAAVSTPQAPLAERRAQQVRPTPLVSHSDLRDLAFFAAGASAALSLDGRITHGLQAPRYQDNAGLRRTATAVRNVGDRGAWIISAGVYAAGRLANRPGLADAGLHAGEAVLVSGLATVGIKALAGRTRAHAAESTDADEFQLIHVLLGTKASFPSGHTVAFAAATAFSAELGRTHPAASRWVTPELYTTAATVSGFRDCTTTSIGRRTGSWGRRSATWSGARSTHITSGTAVDRARARSISRVSR